MDMLQSLKLFAEVVRGGGFSTAARETGLSTASVSRSIAGLEQHLGVQLINRSTRQCNPTEAGEALFGKVERMFEELQDITESVRRFQSAPQGTLRVHARIAVGTLCIAPALPDFLARHGALRIKLSLSNDHAVDLIRNNIDVDIRTGVLPDSSLIARKLSVSRRLLVASPAYVALHGAPRTPQELEQHNCLTYRVGEEDCIWRFKDSRGLISDIVPRGNLDTDSGATLMVALQRGLGICHMTDWAVAEDVRSGRLLHILPDHQVTINAFDHGVFAVHTKSRHSSPKVRAFIDFLVELFKSKQFRLDDEDLRLARGFLEAATQLPVREPEPRPFVGRQIPAHLAAAKPAALAVAGGR